MSTRASKICLTVYAVLLVLSFSLLSVPGDYWVWYGMMVPFAVVPLFSSHRPYRLAGVIALLVAGLLIVEDVVAGKHFREKMREIRRAAAMKAATDGEPVGAANRSQQVRPETNSTSAAAGSGR
jgi:hypothetical protein